MTAPSILRVAPSARPGAGPVLRGRGEQRKHDVTSGSQSLRLSAGPGGKMADLSLDELIRKRGVTLKGR